MLLRDATDDSIYQQLVQIDRPICRVSNLAIHLQTAKEREAFKINKEDDLSPILAMEVEKALDGGASKDDTGSNDEKVTNDDATNDGWSEYQEPALLQLLANELNVPVSDIEDFELSLFDVQKATVGGTFSEFLYSARLDNLASCFLAVEALAEHDDLSNQEDVSVSPSKSA